MQMLGWIARAAGLGRNWQDLARRRLITGAEARDLRSIERFLQHVRIRLHYLAGRMEDRLLFDYQEKLAHAMGFEATAAKRASEVFMQHYYINAKKITLTNTILLQNYAGEIFPARGGPAIVINERFQAVRELLDMRDEDVFERHPSALLECFLILQQRSELTGMTARTLRALWLNRTRINAAFRADPKNRALFLEILQQKRGIVHEFRADESVRHPQAPTCRRAENPLPDAARPLFKSTTVDQHILMVLRNVRRFMMGEHAHEYPLMTRLMLGFHRQRPALCRRACSTNIERPRRRSFTLGMGEAREFQRAHRTRTRGSRSRRVARRASPDDVALTSRRKQRPIPPSSGASPKQCKASAGSSRSTCDPRRILGTCPKVWTAEGEADRRPHFSRTAAATARRNAQTGARPRRPAGRRARAAPILRSCARASKTRCGRSSTRVFLAPLAEEIACTAALLYFRRTPKSRS